jgi:hypothetical protein
METATKDLLIALLISGFIFTFAVVYIEFKKYK